MAHLANTSGLVEKTRVHVNRLFFLAGGGGVCELKCQKYLDLNDFYFVQTLKAVAC